MLSNFFPEKQSKPMYLFADFIRHCIVVRFEVAPVCLPLSFF